MLLNYFLDNIIWQLLSSTNHFRIRVLITMQFFKHCSFSLVLSGLLPVIVVIFTLLLETIMFLLSPAFFPVFLLLLLLVCFVSVAGEERERSFLFNSLLLSFFFQSFLHYFSWILRLSTFWRSEEVSDAGILERH